jgi:hypothetical protein
MNKFQYFKQKGNGMGWEVVAEIAGDYMTHDGQVVKIFWHSDVENLAMQQTAGFYLAPGEWVVKIRTPKKK